MRGGFGYSVYNGWLNAGRFMEFLKKFLQGRRRPVFPVVDGHSAHRAANVARYLQSLRGQLELHFLPGYAPDLKPDEFVWNHVRQHGTAKKPRKRNKSLRRRLEKKLRATKNDPRLVRPFFHAPRVAYLMA